MRRSHNDQSKATPINRRYEQDSFSGQIDRMLDRLPLSEPSPYFTDNVMRRAAQQSDAEGQPSGPFHFARMQRNVLFHFAIASAATYFFISVGLFKPLFDPDPSHWGVELHTTVHDTVQYVLKYLMKG